MDTLTQNQREDFVQRLMPVLRDALPEYFIDTPPKELHDLVSRHMDEALHYGINQQTDTANYIQLRVESGPAFDEALKQDDAFRRKLEDPEVSGSRKVQLISNRFFALE